MTRTKRALLAIAAVSAFGAVSMAPAKAVVEICTGADCVNTDGNINVTKGTAGTVVGKFNKTNIGGIFASTTEATLTGAASGQASVKSGSDALLNELTFTIDGGFGFETALFNLDNFNATSVFVKYIVNGIMGEREQELRATGQNFLGIYGNEGEIFTSVGFRTTDGVSQLKQLRLGGVQSLISAVPEPATWLMMLLGFGGIGYSMRRKKPALGVRFA